MTTPDETNQFAAQALGFDLLDASEDLEVFGRHDLPSTVERQRGSWTLFERDADYEPVGHPVGLGSDEDLDVSGALDELQSLDPQHQRGPSLGI